MPTIPDGPHAGAEYFKLHFSREADDRVTLPDNRTVDVLRISIGGNADLGFYFKFRGDPAEVLRMLEVVYEAAKRQLPAGRYKDERAR